MKKRKQLQIAVFYFALAMIFAAAPAYAQNTSRWALGRPSLLIDMPGEPGGGGVAWAERPMYSIFPSSWSAEGSGVRVEVARIFTTQSPSQLLTAVGQKINVGMTPAGKGLISGREFVNAMTNGRMAVAIGSDGGVEGGASWVVVATFRDQTGQALASSILDSIKVEREGGRHWAIRSLGTTFLAAELPFELAPAEGRPDGAAVFESSFDGMEVRVSSSVPSAGSVFEREATLKGIIERDRSRPGVSDFSFTREKYKLDDKDGDLITLSFKRGGRSYRIYEIAFIDKSSAVIANLQIDPNRSDHAATTERVLRTLRKTINPIYGWKTYAVGDKGLFIDLPTAPSAPRLQGSVTIRESNTPLAMTEIRELEVGFPAAHNPDFSAKQYFDMQASLSPAQKFEFQSMDKLLIDGLEARLVKATWRNGQSVNQRQILTIYGYSTQWIVDMLASKETELYMERLMKSVRVKIAPSPGQLRQSFGTMGVSLIVGDKRLEPTIKQNPSDPDFVREESAVAQSGGNILAIYEMNFKTEDLPPTDARAKTFLDGLLRGMGEAAKIQFTSKVRDSFEINIDGVEGRHIIFDITSTVAKPGSVVQADMIVLHQPKKLWTATVITNYEGGLPARAGRARLLNSIRVGI